MTVKTAVEVYTALQNIDTYNHVNKDKDGEEKIVVVPYKIGGKARWNLTKALSALKLVNDDFIKTRDAIIKEVSGGSGVLNREESEKMEEFTGKLEEVLSQDANTTGLLRVKVKDLNLDESPIPVAVLSLLSPLLDDSE